jgi:hypothetical protein
LLFTSRLTASNVKFYCLWLYVTSSSDQTLIDYKQCHVTKLQDNRLKLNYYIRCATNIIHSLPVTTHFSLHKQLLKISSPNWMCFQLDKIWCVNIHLLLNGQDVHKNRVVESTIMGDLNNITLKISPPKGIATNFGHNFLFV